MHHKAFLLFTSLLALSGVTITSCITFCPLRGADDQVEPVGEYVKSLKSKDLKVRLDAIQSLKRLGPRAEPAIPALIEALNDSDRRVRRGAHAALVNIGKAAVPAVVKALQRKEPNIRFIGAVILHDLGTDAKAGVPSLIELLADETQTSPFSDEAQAQQAPVWYAAQDALFEVGKADVPALIEAIKAKPAPVRARLATIIGHAGKDRSKAAVDALIDALKAPEPVVREHAAFALGRFSAFERKARVDALLTALNDKQITILRSVLHSLCTIGPAAEVPAPLILRFLTHKDPAVRHDAIMALGVTRQPDQEVLNAVGKILADDSNLRDLSAGVSVAGALGTPAKVFIPRLIELLKLTSDKDPEEARGIRSGAAGALGTMGSEARAAVPALIQLVSMKDASLPERGVAIIALGQIGPAAKAAVPVLTDALSDNHSTVRNLAREALKKIE
jgi:HEAT repeat protein